MSSETMNTEELSVVQDSVKEYYGKVLSRTQDLKTNVCMVGKTKIPNHVKEALKLVHDGVTSKYYGCGSVVPECLEGTRVLDLGSGSGQDCYVLSKLVGEKGEVVGLDMTEEQLNTAREYIDYHTKLYGFSKPNVRFVKGYIERLAEAGLEENSFDLIISNCVVNLSPDKRAVLEEAYRVLKVGGEMYFSDVYADRNLTQDIRQHKVLWGECIAGALWWEDLAKLAKEIGFCPPLIVSAFTYNIGNEELQALLGESKFASVTYRLFKPPPTRELACKVIYEGSITGYEDNLHLDHHNTFKTGEIIPVDGDIATILKASRLADDFTFQPCGDASCSTVGHEMNPFKIAVELDASAGGCCPSKPSNTGPTKATDSGCCPPKPSTTSCCPPKSSTTSRCPPKSSTTSCCPPKPSNGSCCPPKPSSGDCCPPK